MAYSQQRTTVCRSLPTLASAMELRVNLYYAQPVKQVREGEGVRRQGLSSNAVQSNSSPQSPTRQKYVFSKALRDTVGGRSWSSPILSLVTGGRRVKKWPKTGYIVCARSLITCTSENIPWNRICETNVMNFLRRLCFRPYFIYIIICFFVYFFSSGSSRIDQSSSKNARHRDAELASAAIAQWSLDQIFCSPSWSHRRKQWRWRGWRKRQCFRFRSRLCSCFPPPFRHYWSTRKPCLRGLGYSWEQGGAGEALAGSKNCPNIFR